MQSKRKSDRSGEGDHSPSNPLRSENLNTNVGRKPARTGSPSRDQKSTGADDAQDVSLTGKNLQAKGGADKAKHSRTAEIENAPLVDRKVS